MFFDDAKVPFVLKHDKRSKLFEIEAENKVVKQVYDVTLDKTGIQELKTQGVFPYNFMQRERKVTVDINEED